MAEDGYLFGGTTADYVVAAEEDTGRLFMATNTDVWFYNQQSGGTRHTSGLTDLTGATITSVTSDGDGGIPQLRGPSNVPWLWADASQGDGPRRLMVPADTGIYISDMRSTLSTVLGDLADAQTLLAASLGVVEYDAETSSWPPRPPDGRRYAWLGPTAPSGMAAGDLWFNTSPGS